MKPPNEIPDAAEFGLLRSYLAKNRPSNKTPREWNTEIASIIGTNDRTRAEVVADLRAWMKDWTRLEMSLVSRSGLVVKRFVDWTAT